MARVSIKQKVKAKVADIKKSVKSFVQPRVAPPTPQSVVSRGKTFTPPSFSNLRANITSPSNLLSAVPQAIRTKPVQTFNRAVSNTKFLINNPASRQFAPSTAGDFIRGDYGLSKKSKSPVVQTFRENVGDLSQQSLGGLLRTGQGIGNIRRPGLLNKAQGLSQIVGGLSSSYLSANPLGIGTTLISNMPRMGNVDPLRRVAAGMQSSFSGGEGLDANVQSKNFNINMGDKTYSIDPLKTVGEMTGYVLRPENRRFFKITEKLLPGSSKSLAAWGTVTGTRGGIEGLFSGLQTLPENLSTKQKIDYMTKQGLYGVASELLIRGAGKSLKSVGNATLKTGTSGSGLVGLREASKQIPEQKINRYLVKMFNDLLIVRDRLVKAGFDTNTKTTPEGVRLSSTGEFAQQPRALAESPLPPIQSALGDMNRPTTLIDNPRNPNQKVRIYTDTNEPVVKGAMMQRAIRDQAGSTAPSYLKRDVVSGVIGAQAGWERDEEGNIGYDPQKGFTGVVAGLGISRQLSGRKIKLGLGTEEVSNPLAQEARKYASAEEFESAILGGKINPERMKEMGFEFVNSGRIRSPKGMEIADIYNQAMKTAPEAPLQNEARKYKSAEEFVKAQGTPLYRGGADLSREKITNAGISFSKGKNVAEDFVKQKGGGVEEFLLSPSSKIIDYQDIPDVKFKNLNDYSPELDMGNRQIWKDLEIEYQKAVGWAKSNGYDGVRLPLEGETRVVNPDIFKTKSQLTDIWNKAQGGTGQERGFVTNVKGSQTALPELKTGLNETQNLYDPITNKQTIEQTKFDLDTEGWDASKKRVFDEPLSADTNILGQQLIKRAQDEGRFDEAIEIVETLSKKGTEAGQAVQAFSVWSKLSPEGMLKYAVNQIDTAKQQMGFATKTARGIFGSETPEIKPEDAKIITDLMKKAQSATSEQEQADYARAALEHIGKKIPWGVSEIIDEYRYNNMLSGPLTHMRNLYSNVLQSTVVRPATLAAQGKISDAVKYEVAALKSIPAAFIKAVNVFKTGKKLQRLDDIMDAGAGQFKPKRLGKLYNIPSSALEASDTFFTTLIKQGELARGATKEEAQKAAEYWVFRQGLNSKQQGVILNSIDNMTKGIYGLRKVGLGWVIPFLQTPMNVAKQGLEFSPVGVLTTIGASNKKEQLAKAGLGSIAALVGASLAMEDRTTWDVPVDKAQRDLFYASGKKPYSIKIGDKWVPMQYLGPFAWSVGLPAAYKHYQENSRTALTDTQLQKLMSASMSGAKFWSQQTFMQGLGQFVKLAEGDTDYDLPKIVSNFASQVNPMTSLQRYIAQVVDPVFRKASGDTFVEKVTQRLQTGIPGQSKKLEAYTNPLGEESRRNASNYVAPWGMGKEDLRFTGALESRQKTTQVNAFATNIENSYEPDVEKVSAQLSKQLEDELLAGMELTDEQRLAAIQKIQSKVRTKVRARVLASKSQEIATQIKQNWGETPEEKAEFLKVMKSRGLLTEEILDALLAQ